ncbi:hypothetical protein [Mycetocola zhujimingii]|uniref:hypothetical protein n=1 Tax=Mycetocola zhujimingii TaxID=2079792 RepID=UPI0013C3F944|nr:hypothetical protein [Mycetocola zhujimingii]
MPVPRNVEAKPVLEILAISDHEWRVCDGRFRQSDARRMLGYIGRTANVYELVRLQQGPGWERFDTLQAALDALVEPSGQPAP